MSPRRVEVLGVVCALAGVGLGLVVRSRTPRFDAAAVRHLHHWLARSPLVVDALKAVTSLGSAPVLAVVCVAAVWKLDRRSALVVVLALVFAVAAGAGLKAAFDRPRPVLLAPFGHAASSSYPSGHTIQAAAVYGAIAVLRRRWVLPGAVVAAVAFSRVALGFHYPTDVVGGALFGAALVIALTAGARRRTAAPMPPPPR